MALRFYVNNATTLLDFTANSICRPKLTISYQRPCQFEFDYLTQHLSLPLIHNDFVQFFDDAFSATIPVFEGHIRQQTPDSNGDPNKVHVVCKDVTDRVAEEVFPTNGLVTNNTVIPRVVYNVTNDSDDDNAFNQLTYDSIVTAYGSTAVFATVGQILQDLIDNQQPVLYPLHAGPSNGTTPSYVLGDLTPMDLQIQDKIVFDSEAFLSATNRLLTHYPAKRLFFDVSTRQFRVHQPIDAADVTMTLNQFNSGGVPLTNPVVELNIERSLQRRYTAITLSGKPQTAFADVDVYSGGLTPVVIPGDTAPRPAGAYRRWQVNDATKRHISRAMLPGQLIQVGIPHGGQDSAGIGVAYQYFDYPVLLVSYDPAISLFLPVSMFQINVEHGYVQSQYYLWATKPDGMGGKMIVLPSDIRFVFNYFTQAITLRYPSSGYSGICAGSPFNVTANRQFYHELLNTGYLKWDVTTQNEKVTQYTKLAVNWLRQAQDPVYGGHMSQLGIDYTWVRLNKRVNFAAVDANGNSFTTGLEAAHCIVSDVTYDYQDIGHTLVSFSSDYSAYFQQDIESMRLDMGIRARSVYRQYFRGGNWTDAQGNFHQQYGFYTYKVGEEG